MSWGTGSWGLTPWGTGATLPPPSLIGVSTDSGPAIPKSDPAVIDSNGGTICLLTGSNFFDPMTIEILRAGTAVAEGYIVDPEFDLERNRVFFGSPALEAGLYSIRVTTEGGDSPILADVIAARRFAHEYKTVSVRGKFSPKWATGPRILRG